MKQHHSEDLIQLFNHLFEESENTILVGNAEEPIYLPADVNSPFNRVIFTRDYFASALHEIAHWCIASKERRKKIDYGYWYFPEGRTAEQQALFQQAEIKPQALESIFSQAAGSRFIASVDSFSPDQAASTILFEKQIAEQAQRYLSAGMPERAELFVNELTRFYAGSLSSAK